MKCNEINYEPRERERFITDGGKNRKNLHSEIHNASETPRQYSKLIPSLLCIISILVIIIVYQHSNPTFVSVTYFLTFGLVFTKRMLTTSVALKKNNKKTMFSF